MPERIENQTPEDPPCTGTAHAWRLLPYDPALPNRAVATCCGVTATHLNGAWVVHPAITVLIANLASIGITKAVEP